MPETETEQRMMGALLRRLKACPSGLWVLQHGLCHLNNGAVLIDVYHIPPLLHTRTLAASTSSPNSVRLPFEGLGHRFLVVPDRLESGSDGYS